MYSAWPIIFVYLCCNSDNGGAGALMMIYLDIYLEKRLE